MPQKILIATLGDHPAVVTGMVRALEVFNRILVDKVVVLHPQNTGKDIAQLGFALIQEHLDGACDVQPVPLPFDDPNSTESCTAFLAILAEVMAQYCDPEQHRVYLSLAGGRKNMSVLMALVTQFFPAVSGLYHLVDVREHSRRHSFPSIETIVLMDEGDARRALSPAVENLQLVEIPYPGAFSDGQGLWTALRTGDPVSLSPEAEHFFRQIAGRPGSEPRLSIKMSDRAVEDYRKLGPQKKRKFVGYARRMQYPEHLEAKASGPRGWETDCQVYPERGARANLRLLYHWNRDEDTVVVCRVMLHQQYDRKGTVWYDDHLSASPLSILEREVVLVVPLGKAPMVATQTHTMLKASEEEGKPLIPTVVTIYPQGSASVRASSRVLERQFQRRGIEYRSLPIAGLRDVDSKQACERYARKLTSALRKLRHDYPDREIALSLSGGRKAMTAMTFFTAQRAGVERLYHTLVSDIDLERRVKKETSRRALERLATDDARARRLFLEAYERESFELFRVPVIPLRTRNSRSSSAVHSG